MPKCTTKSAYELQLDAKRSVGDSIPKKTHPFFSPSKIDSHCIQVLLIFASPEIKWTLRLGYGRVKICGMLRLRPVVSMMYWTQVIATNVSSVARRQKNSGKSSPNVDAASRFRTAQEVCTDAKGEQIALSLYCSAIFNFCSMQDLIDLYLFALRFIDCQLADWKDHKEFCKMRSASSQKRKY